MTNAEGMTKSEDRDARTEDSFWDDGAAIFSKIWRNE
jgi:hypothetical protein